MDPLSALPPSLAARVKADLQPGETVRWAGVPGWLQAMLPMLPMFVFGIGWSSISFTFFGVALASLFADPSPKTMGPGMGSLFLLFSLPFVAVGVGMLGLPAYAALKAMLTAHVVTDRRLVTVVGGPWNTVEIRSAVALTFLRRRDGKAGRGSLMLGFGTERDSDGDVRSVHDDWRGIPQVRDAEEAVRELAAAAGRVL